MAKRHKKHKHEEHVDESWLIPYADVLTLLLALFIVMFAASQVDQDKMKQVSEVFQEVFEGGTGIMDGNPSMDKNPNPPTQTKATGASSGEKNSEDAQMEALKEQFQQEIENLKGLQQQLNDYISSKHLDAELSTELSTKGLLVTIQDGVFFSSGSSVVKADGIPTARELANILSDGGNRNIEISGHTDNVPINNGNFKSNWELSSGRAINFLEVLLEDKRLDPARFSVNGAAEFKPIADNKLPEGRQKNRRVEILILPNIEQKQTTWDEAVKEYQKQNKSKDSKAKKDAQSK
ncbi:flagellar motor protein MotB [Bacillus cereus]